MPAILFEVRWPDGGLDTCYSPSTIIEDYFEIGRPYSLSEFIEMSRQALRAASERVRQRYGGSGCARAMSQLAAIEATAARQQDNAAMPVRVERFRFASREVEVS